MRDGVGPTDFAGEETSGATFRLTRVALALAAFAAVAGPGSAQSRGSALLTADREVADSSARRGLEAMVARMTPEGVLLWPGAPIASGPEEVRRLLAAQGAADSITLTWQPLGVELAADSALGLTWGVAAGASPAAPPALGRYLAVWRWSNERWDLAGLVLIGLPLRYVPPASTPPPRAALPAAGPARAFIAADLAFARLAADSGAALAFERWAAPDALLPGGLLSRGPAEIGRAVGAGGPAAWRWHPVLAGASASGDLGFTVGEAVITRPGGSPAYSKYLTVWRRLPDGSVRFIIDGGNPRPRGR